VATAVTALFFLSGLVALAYEVVWVRALGLVVGNSLWAAVVVVAAYMGGMAVGASLVARFLPRIRRHLRLYAVAEAVAAVAALSTPVATAWLARVASHLGAEPIAGWGLPLAGRFGLAWLFLAAPTVAMGATLPLLIERVGTGRLATRVSRLYSANTFGAVAGVLLTAFVGLPTLGERATLSVAATLGLAVALVAWGLEPHVPTAVSGGKEKARLQGWLLFPALFGFVALSCELVWTRVLLLHLGSRVYAFAVILAVYLLGIAAGAPLARLARGRERGALALCELALAVTLGLQLLAFAHLGDLMSGLVSVLRPGGFAGVQLALGTAVAMVLLLPTALFGASFPLTVAASPGGASDGAQTGVVAAANTAGGILGTVAGPLVLVAVLGSQDTLLVLAAASALAASALAARRSLRVAAIGAAAALAACVWLLPSHAILRGAAVIGEGEVEELWESASATVVVRHITDARGSWRSLELNGVNVAGTSPELWAIQRLQGHLPLLLHPGPERVLHIGFGSGGTASAVARHPVARIDIAEISPEVLAVSRRAFREVNHGVLGDPRVRIFLNDGRNMLLASRERWDVILSDSIHPVYAGNSTLYTREYFELCRDHLRPGGVVSMWLPMYSLSWESYLAILRAFWETFPSTCVWYDPIVVNEFTVVTGSREPGGIKLRWEALLEPGLLDSLAEAGAASPRSLAEMLLLGPGEVASLVERVLPHIDDFPEVEYRSGRVLDREGSWLTNFTMLRAGRARTNPFAGLPVSWSEVVAERDRLLEAHVRALRSRVSSR